VNDDLDVTPTTQSSAADPLYNAIYGDATAEVAPRRQGFPVIPPFTAYVVKPLKAQTHRTEANVSARVQVEILEGPGETSGKKITDNGGIWFVVSRNKKDRQGKVLGQLDDAAYAQKRDRAIKSLNRIRKALGLTFAWPQGGLHDAAVDQYCAQFAQAQPFVVEIRVEKDGNGTERNRIVWESAAALDEPQLDSGDKPTGKTAHEAAQAMIKQQNERRAQAKGGGSAQPTQTQIG